jgi:spermidine synthase
MKPWITVGEALSPDGTRLELVEHDGEYIIRADDLPLMSTRMHYSEVELARIVCKKLKPGAKLMIGGLGLGYTLRSALDLLPKDGKVVQVELVPEVIEWNKGPLSPFADHPLKDKRTILQLEDVTKVIRGARNEYDSIMLDVDNGPSPLVNEKNGWLYSDSGLLAIRSALKNGGQVAIWSADDEPRFISRMRRNSSHHIHRSQNVACYLGSHHEPPTLTKHQNRN